MIYGYIRVSTDRQTLENQRFEILQFCKNNNLTVDLWIQETISGTKAADVRKLGIVLQKARKGDLILCTELSRLGRNMFMVMDMLHHCMERDCHVWTVKEGYRLGDDIQSKVLAFAFGMAADIERQLISQRTREALARRKAEGARLGRQTGSRNRSYKLDAQANLIRKMMDEGISHQQMARRLGVSRATLLRWLKCRNVLF